MKIPVCVNFERSQMTLIDRICEKEDMTRSEVVRRLVSLGLKEWRRGR